MSHPTDLQPAVAPSLAYAVDGRRARTLLAVYTAAIFTSAFLLFLVQPMFSKQVLPLLGGTPAVWNTCMLFFQSTLLAGYLYAHLVTRWLPGRRQVGLHLAVLALAALTLPIGVAGGWTSPSPGYPTLWLLGLLAVSIGAPFFVLSSSGPLLQKWFSGTAHPDARNPYFLYAASNLGSMIALLGYPLLVEPRWGVAEQARAWGHGFWLLVALSAACAWLWRAGAGAAADAPTWSAAADPAPGAEPLTAARRARWVLLAFAPSSLLLGVTTYITTDVAAVPLLWVIPLALYLLTFIVAFARRPPVPHAAALRLQPFLVIPLVILMFWGMRVGMTAMFGLNLAAFFVTALVCHGELARDRPAVLHLTEFYLLLALGGALGGAFNVLVAPHLFTSIAEYPLVLVLACLLRPRPRPAGGERGRSLRDVGFPLALGAAAAGVTLLRTAAVVGDVRLVLLPASIALAVSLLAFADRPVRFGLGLGAVLLAAAMLPAETGAVLHAERTFFGTHRVAAKDGGAHHVLIHGTTVHGAQFRDPARSRVVTSYYHAAGPLGQLFDHLRERGRTGRVAVVGLGTGAMACHGRAGERWTFFEIDPAVVRIARDPRFFTFLRDCPPGVDVVLGDARLTLAGQPAGAFDLLVVDAFSSDAIPAHLLTREALTLYLERLAPGGVLALHLSNRHLDLEPVVARLQHALGADALITRQSPDEDQRRDALAAGSIWAVLAADAGRVQGLAGDPRWRAPFARPGVGLWTDDFIHLLRVYRGRGHRAAD
jgi:hypothetical protein